jgi:hypothetical protein
MREAITIEIVEARMMRLKTKQNFEEQEVWRRDNCLLESIAWLKCADELQYDELERLSQKRHWDTCGWFPRNPLFKIWNDDAHNKEPVLWVKGIPGAGRLS